MVMYTVLLYNIFGKVFDFNQNLNARLGVLHDQSDQSVHAKSLQVNSNEEAVWLLSDSKKACAVLQVLL